MTPSVTLRHRKAVGARDHMIRVTRPATTALLGRKNAGLRDHAWTLLAADELDRIRG